MPTETGEVDKPSDVLRAQWDKIFNIALTRSIVPVRELSVLQNIIGF